jgi:hypothetical protein
LSEAESYRAFDGRRIIVSEERRRHIKIRHPEIGSDVAMLAKALVAPDEAYENGRGGVHSLMRIDEGHFLVVIYEASNNEGFVSTAYITSVKRKERRYRGLQSLKRS